MERVAEIKGLGSNVEKHNLAEELRDFEISILMPIDLIELDDDELIYSYTTCPHCGKPCLDDEEREAVVILSVDFEEFFELIEINAQRHRCRKVWKSSRPVAREASLNWMVS